MPFKSEAQRRLFYAKAERGEISRETVREWEDATGKKKLPARVREKRAGANDALTVLGFKLAADVSDHNRELGLSTALAQTLGRLSALPTGLLLKPTDPLFTQRAMDKEDAEKLVAEFEAKYPGLLNNTKVRIGGSHIWDEMKRTWNNERQLPGVRHLLAPLAGLSAAQSAMSRADHYSPLSDTVTIYNDDPAILAHELGHAADINQMYDRNRILGSVYSGPGTNLLSNTIGVPLTLAKELRASGNAVDVLKNRGADAEDQAWSTLAPAFGTYLGAAGAFAHNRLTGRPLNVPNVLGMSGVTIGGAALGHGVAALRNAIARRNRENESHAEK